MTPRHAQQTLEQLAATYPDARCSLEFTDPWQLLTATILSAQCTDERVNRVTPILFARWPCPAAMAAAEIDEIAACIRSVGCYRTKARSLWGAARLIVADFGGEVPSTMEQLLRLPGVGRKTANVVLGNVFSVAGMVVDTHVKRIAFRLGWTKETEPERVEQGLCRLLPTAQWILAGHILIRHGRALCKAPTPICSRCPVALRCPRQGVIRAR